MRPTSTELIAGIGDTLRQRIAPLVADDAWAASYLRSVDTLLRHLEHRIGNEREALLADNAELRILLAEIGASAGPTHDTGDGDGEATVETLERTNTTLRAALERAIHRIHRDGDGVARDSVRAYLVRAADRDAQLYAVFSQHPPF